MEEFLIHQFYKKLLQKSVFPHLKAYLAGRRTGLAPISINLDLVTACNFKCPHCLDGDIINTGKMLDLEYVKRIIEDWSKEGLRSVILIGGGEPTLYYYFEKVVEFLKKLHLQVGIVTNGTNLKKIENVCHLLGKKDWVRLSLDAGKNETFQKIHSPRLKITLEDILIGIKKIRRLNSSIQLGFSYLIIGSGKKVKNTPLANNIKEIGTASALAKESGFSYFSLKPFISLGGNRGTTISKKDLKEIKEEIKKAKKFEDSNFKIVESVNLLCFYDKELKKIMQKQPKTCHAQFFRSVVIPAGIYSCSLWRGFESTKMADTNKKINKKYYYNLWQNREKLISSFNAKKICKEVNCLYAPLNCWIEDLIDNPEKIKKLKPIADFNDYFL